MPLFDQEGRERMMRLKPEDLPVFMNHETDSTSDRGCTDLADSASIKNNSNE